MTIIAKKGLSLAVDIALVERPDGKQAVLVFDHGRNQVRAVQGGLVDLGYKVEVARTGDFASPVGSERAWALVAQWTEPVSARRAFTRAGSPT